MESIENTANIRVIVDAHHDLAFASAHELSHPLILFEREIDPVAGGLPVRRVHVEEGVRSIVALRTVEPRQILDVGAGQPLPGGGQVLLDAQQVDGRSGGGGTERLPSNFAAEGVLLQVEEPGCALDIGQRLRSCHLLPLEDLAGRQRPFELPDKFLKVVLHHPVQVDQIAVEVIQDLHLCWLRPHEVEGSTTSKDLDVALMGREKRNQAVGQAALAAHPGDNWVSQFANLYCIDKQVLGSPCFVHRAGALAGLAGMVCGFGGQQGC